LNAVQIKNKNLADDNAKLAEKLLGKERLIAHLEGKVTSIMVDNEDVTVKLKSEIVLL
jgi:3-methyladenine DNA glycosylase Mpg